MDVQDQTQPEGAAPEPTTDAPAEESYDQLLERAAAAMDEAAPEQDEQPAQEPAGEPAEPEAAPEPAAEPEAAEGPAEDKDQAPPWQFAQLRRQQKAIAREREELQKLADELRPLKDDLSAMPDPRRDPLAFSDWAAARAGLTPAQLYERQTHRQLRDGQPDPAAEVEAMRRELDQFKAAQAKREQEAAARAEQARQAELLREDVGGVGQALTSVGQYAAAWPKERFEREAQAAVQWAYQNAPEMTYEAIAGALESMAKAEYEQWHGQLQKTLGGNATEDRDTSKARDGQGPPGAAAPKPAGTPMPRSTLTNNDAAQGGAAHRELTDEERWAKAGELLAAGT